MNIANVAGDQESCGRSARQAVGEGSAGAAAGYSLTRHGAVLAHGDLFPGGEHTQEVVGHARSLRLRRLGSGDVEAAVHLRRPPPQAHQRRPPSSDIRITAIVRS